MKADSVNTFTYSYYSPTNHYMVGVQGNWLDSDSQDRGGAMYIWMLEEKIHERETAT